MKERQTRQLAVTCQAGGGACHTGRDVKTRVRTGASQLWQLLLFGAMCALVGCSDSSAPPKAGVVPTPVDAATAGSINVTVRYQGTLPAPKQIEMSSASQCAAAHPEPGTDQALLVNESRLANALVWIKTGLDHWVIP